MVSYAVTGASRGIGFAITTELASNPSNQVFGLVRNPETASALRELAATHSNLHIVTADITKPVVLESAVARIESITGGGLDVLVQNAAWVGDNVSTPWNVLTANEPDKTGKFRENLVEAIDTNVIGMMNVVRIFRPLVSKGHVKKIVVISTALADLSFTKTARMTYHVPYAASKAAMNLVIAKMAIELKEEDILLCAICPGWVKVDPKPRNANEQAAFEKMRDLFRGVQPELERQQTALESARAVLDVVSSVSMEQSGRLIPHTGTDEWLSRIG